ncbi:MAG: DNA primase [Alphaproteobacteria bacterium]|nr:DNA primase [Alphaproteobacteria bacterium]
MAFPPGFLDELRGRVSLAALVGRRVRLTRKGRELAGLCPFHNEKTPSFYVVEDKGFFHCFGCGAHGDAIGFTMRADNLDFVEAVERLAAEAGLAVPQSTPHDRERAQRQKTLLEALSAAAEFYEARLWSPAGARAREYLLGRGLDDETMRRFRLGWAPEDRHVLRRALTGEFPEALLIEAGLLRRPDNGGDPYDYFRERIIFPIGDRSGRPIAFGGRTIADAQPKYLNSPEHPLFEKGRVLYGWSAARANAAPEEEARRSGAIVVEGYMDVIALHRAGFATAVAPLGTALTEAQLAELWRLAAEPVLCFDGDAAGQRAAVRALRRALPLLKPGHSLRFATLPAGEDPDSLLRGGGRAAFEQVLAAARSLADMLWESEVRGVPRDTPERVAGVRARLMDHLQTISDRTVRSEFEALVKKRCDPWEARRKKVRASPGMAVRDGPPPPPPMPGRRRHEILLRMLLQFPFLIEEASEEIAEIEFREPELDKLRREILEVEALRPALDARALRQHLDQNGFAATVDALLSPRAGSVGVLSRDPDLGSVRLVWEHVLKLSRKDHGSELARAAEGLRNEGSPESWERFLAFWGRETQEDVAADELLSGERGFGGKGSP